MDTEIQTISNDVTTYEQSIRADVDIQITTAKKYPRDKKKFLENSLCDATHSDQAAIKCGYTLPRGEKKIQGISVHLARILAQNYGNIRVSAKSLSISDVYVTAEAVCLDLETNLAVRVETRQKIIDSKGRRYNDDMINITMLACIAKAERNAILHVIPASYSEEVYLAAQQKLIGDVKKSPNTLDETRVKALKSFNDKYGVTEAMILKYFGKQKVEQLDAEDVVSLRGLFQALKDGDATVESTFMDDENPDGETVKAKADRFYHDEPNAEIDGELFPGKVQVV